jgi:hypothetical protein
LEAAPCIVAAAVVYENVRVGISFRYTKVIRDNVPIIRVAEERRVRVIMVGKMRRIRWVLRVLVVDLAIEVDACALSTIKCLLDLVSQVSIQGLGCVFFISKRVALAVEAIKHRVEPF